MALLQIAEPGMSTAPHQHRLAVGIDLGTTNSLVATVRSGSPEVLSDEEGRSLLPSIVRYLDNGHAHIGHKAQHAPDHRPEEHDRLGQALHGPRPERHRACRKPALRLRRWRGHGPDLNTVAGVKSPVEISAQILATLRQRAEDSLGDDLVGAVITVPAYFDDAQRQATKDAAQLAGLNVLRLLSEPTAAAIAYGLDQGKEGIYAVYDLGGGTFDISILKLSKGVFEVLSTGGDSALGGDDFDHRLFCWITEQARLAPLSDQDTATLMVKARQAKELLSTNEETTIDAILKSGELVQVTITASEFVEITKHLVGKTMNAIRKAMRDADASVEDVDGVVMVGGATRMPHVRRAVSEFFQTIPHANIDPDQRRGAGRGDPGQSAGRQPRRWRRLAAAGRDAAVAGHRDDGRPGRKDHSAQFDDPGARARRNSRPSRMARRRWRYTWCRASASWCRTAARWRASSCAASRRWRPAQRASA